jgi:hypothetical protein
MTEQQKASPRAREFWKRMLSWYGARLADQYGMTPPADWCATVDRAGRTLDAALVVIRKEHAVHPPTWPQFDSIVSRVSRAIAAGPSMQSRLVEHALRAYGSRLTPAQLRAAWTFHFLENECVCVDIPDDGEVKGMRVRAADIPTWQNIGA